MAKALFGAGCFWGPEAAFRKIDGVIDATVGYAGGHADNPTYPQVCTKTTGHAEVVLVEYDESRVTYQDLLAAFFAMHDPTQLNRQGPDVGNQYRSVIFTYDPDQQAAAEQAKAAEDASGRHGGRPVVTDIQPAPTFWPAEEYHQRYYEKRGWAQAI